MIIFDWDDTLLCTSAVTSTISDVALTDLVDLEEVVLSLLELAESLGRTVIVTSSEQGWVESSAESLMPSVLPLLAGIPVIYAREKYANIFPGDSFQWKLQTFLQLQRVNASTITNVVVIGDSQDEMQASSLLGERWPGIHVKQVKLLERPSLPELMQQLRSLREEFKSLVKNDESMKLEPRLKPMSTCLI